MQEELHGNPVVRTTLFHCRSHWVQSLVGELRFHTQCVLSRSVISLFSPLDCSLPGSSVHGIFQAKILEEVVISSSCDLPQGSNLPLLHWQVILYHCATWEAELPNKYMNH